MSSHEFPYQEGVATVSDTGLIQGDDLYVELGPSSAGGPPGSVLFTVADAASVRDGDIWPNNTKSFDTPTDVPLVVTTANAAGTEKKVKLHIKPSGGLPGESPV